MKSRSIKTGWNQTRGTTRQPEQRNGQVLKSRQQKEPKTLCGISAPTSRLNLLPADTQSSDCESSSHPSQSARCAKRDRNTLRKSPPGGKLVQRSSSTRCQQKAGRREGETSHDSDATFCEPLEEGHVSPPNSRGEASPAAQSPAKDYEQEGPHPAKEAHIVEKAFSLLDNTAEPLRCDAGNDLEYNERGCREASSHNDTTVAEAKLKKSVTQNIRHRQTPLQDKVQEKEIYDDSDATVGDLIQEEEEEEASTAADEHAQSQSQQTDEEPGSQSLLLSLPMSTLVHVTYPSGKNNERRKTKRKEVKESSEFEMGRRQEELDDSNTAEVPDIVDETSSLLVITANPPMFTTSDELEYNERGSIESSSYDDPMVAQKDKDTLKPKKKKENKSIRHRWTLLQDKAQEEEMCDDSNATVCELDVEQKIRSLNNGKASTSPSFLQVFSKFRSPPKYIVHDVNNDSLCRKNKDGRKKKRKGIEGSAEDKMVQRQEEPEGPHLTEVPKTREQATSLLDNTSQPPICLTGDEVDYGINWVQGSSKDAAVVAHKDRDTPVAKPKKKTENKSSTQNISHRRTLFQEEALEEEMPDDYDAKVSEPNEEESVSPPNSNDLSTATEHPTQLLHADDQSQPGLTEGKSESPGFPQNLPTSFIHDINNDSLCRKNKDKRKKKRKKVDKSTEDEMDQRLEGLEGPISAEVPNIIEMSSILDKIAASLVCQTGGDQEYNERSGEKSLSHDHTEKEKRKTKKKMKDKSCTHARWVEYGNSDEGVRIGVFGLSGSCNDENSVKKKKKKRKREEDAKQLPSSPTDEPPSDVARLKKLKKKRKKDKFSYDERNESQNTAMSVEAKDGSEMVFSSERTNESTDVKKKNHKKSRQLCTDASAREEENVLGASFRLEPVTWGDKNVSCATKRKSEKGICDDLESFDGPEESEQVLDQQNIAEGPKDQNAYKKKKKRSKEKLSVTQNDDSVSAKRKEKKRSSSFLVADVEKSEAQTDGKEMCPSPCVKAPVWVKENSAASQPGDSESAEVTGTLENHNAVVKRKNKKRKRLHKQEGVEKESAQDSDEAHKTPTPAVQKVKCKKKKLHVSKEVDDESLVSGEHYGYCPTDIPAVRQKKKKNKKKRQSTPGMTEETE